MTVLRPPSPANPSSDADDRRAWADSVLAAVARLGPRQEQVTRLIYFEGRSQAEAADTLGLTVGEVADLVVRALRTLSVTSLAAGPTRVIPGGAPVAVDPQTA